MGRAVGVDLHANRFLACFREADGKEHLEGYKIEDLGKFAQTLCADDELAVESTINTRFFVDAIRDHVGSVTIVDAAKFKVISESVQKTDKRDAQTLALFLSKGLLPRTRLKSKVCSQLLSMAQCRQKLVKARTQLKNKIANLMIANGIVFKKKSLSSNVGLQRVLKTAVDECTRVELSIIVEQIGHLNEGVAKLEKQIKERGSELPGYRNITSITGIGAISGTILLSLIGDIHDFASEKQLAAYFGIVPRVSDSNTTIRHGSITKRGTSLGRHTLVLCTWVATTRSLYLRRFYQRLKERKNSGKAIVATSRKLLSIIYKTLKHDWVFENFGTFEIKVA